MMFLITMLAVPAFAQDYYIYTAEESLNINIYEKASAAVVAITKSSKKDSQAGTGFIISSSGHILTSKHLIDGASKVSVYLSDGTKVKGKVLKVSDEDVDLALIKIDSGFIETVLAISKHKELKVGQKIYTISNPFGFDRTFGTGIITRLECNRKLIQMNAKINPGSSGAPVLNSRGEVIGVVQSLYNPEKSHLNIGISFATPLSEILDLLNPFKSDIIPSGIDVRR